MSRPREQEPCPGCGEPKWVHHRTCRSCYRAKVARHTRTAIRAYLQDFGLSAEDLAEQTGITARSIRRYASGAVTPSPAHILLLHEETDIPLETLLRGE